MKRYTPKIECAPVVPRLGNDYFTTDEGIYRPFKFTVKAIGFDGAFHFREHTIYVRFEGIGHSLMELWNTNGQLTSQKIGFYPRYEYTASKD